MYIYQAPRNQIKLCHMVFVCVELDILYLLVKLCLSSRPDTGLSLCSCCFTFLNDSSVISHQSSVITHQCGCALDCMSELKKVAARADGWIMVLLGCRMRWRCMIVWTMFGAPFSEPTIVPPLFCVWSGMKCVTLSWASVHFLFGKLVNKLVGVMTQLSSSKQTGVLLKIWLLGWVIPVWPEQDEAATSTMSFVALAECHEWALRRPRRWIMSVARGTCIPVLHCYTYLLCIPSVQHRRSEANYTSSICFVLLYFPKKIMR